MSEKKDVKINFEEAMKKLENIANELESGEKNLEESIQLFEEGMKISKQCNEILTEAEKKITVLINGNEGIEEKDFVAEDA